ncbi:hypothetical protein B0H11DRAFT_588199 [Mycena galericulata]|nr:hypothetical protein B0H11DRAFT_588199 [Mycena galericulata]
MTAHSNLTFTLSARGGVAPWTWLDHPAGTVGVFVDSKTGLPSNGFYLIPGIDRTVQFLPNENLSKNPNPNPADFVLRSLWNQYPLVMRESVAQETEYYSKSSIE